MANTLVDFYLSYKKTTKIALDWLSTEPRSVVKWESKGRFRSTREITDFAKRLPRQCDIPPFVINALRDAVETRRKVHLMYKKLHASASNTSVKDSDDAHEAFIDRCAETTYP